MKFFLRKKVYAAAAAALTLVWVLLYANRYHIYRCLPARDGGELVLSGGVLVDRVAHQRWFCLMTKAGLTGWGLPVKTGG